MGVSGWTISRRGNRWIVVFENRDSFAQVILTEGQAVKFAAELSARTEQ